MLTANPGDHYRGAAERRVRLVKQKRPWYHRVHLSTGERGARGGLGSRGGAPAGSARGHRRPRPSGRPRPPARLRLRRRSVRGAEASAGAAPSAPRGPPACLCPGPPRRPRDSDGEGGSAVK